MKALVTGATGFLGGALTRKLIELGHAVTVTGRSTEKGRDLESAGARFEPAALSDASAISPLCEGQDWVFHCGALSSAWGKYDDFYRANVVGTDNVIQGCERHGVSRLIHISTPSIYFEFRDREKIREDDPLPSKFINHYARTKYEAELNVVAARERGLESVILRPRAIFGPGDTTLFPRILRNLESGRFRIVGDEQNLADLTHVDNCVHACLLAARTELTGEGIYNISDGKPVKLWRVLRHMASELGLPFPEKSISQNNARRVARGLEKFNRVFRPEIEPRLTEYAVGILTHTMTMSIDRARQDLGYKPIISTWDGVDDFLKLEKATR